MAEAPNTGGDQWCLDEPTTSWYSPPEEPAGSNLAAYIGKPVASVRVWDHEPFNGRPAQYYTFSFSENLRQQYEDSELDFELLFDSVSLKPRYVPQDMFLATVNPTLAEDRTFRNPVTNESADINPILDIVGSAACATSNGKNMGSKLPGSKEYNTTSENADTGRNAFPHQLWIHIGSLLRAGVPVHPSEYGDTRDAILARRPSQPFGEIDAAPIFDYQAETYNGTSVSFVSQASKNPPSAQYPVHWTVQKFIPCWQGEDFFVTVKIGDRKTDDIVDPYLTDNPPTIKDDKGNVTIAPEVIDSDWEQYKYLLFQCDKPPQGSSVGTSGGTGLPTPPDIWTPGISNEAYWINPEETSKSSTGAAPDGTPKKSKNVAREKYWWKYKTYLLIEMGVETRDHNYYIELCKGRKPRFITVGYEWDNPNRLKKGAELKRDDWRFMKKSRVLSEYPGLLCDELFKQKEFRVSVKNQKGRLIITFQGREKEPWVVERRDNDPEKTNVAGVAVKQPIPVVVAEGPVRIHGGNLSCAVNFSVTSYVPSARIPFYDRQIDTKSLADEDIYLLFSHLGSSAKGVPNDSGNDLYDEPRFGSQPVGFDLDAYKITEVVKGDPSFEVYVYKQPGYYDRQALPYGKGWFTVSEYDAATTGYAPTTVNVFDEHPFEAKILTPEGLPRSISEKQFPNYQYREYAAIWNIEIELVAGTAVVPSNLPFQYVDEDGVQELYIDSDATQHQFENVATPIVASWRIHIFGGANPIKLAKEDGKISCFDIAPLVQQIEDGWTTEDYCTFNHEASVTCYIPFGVPVEGDVLYNTSEDSDATGLGCTEDCDACPTSENILALGEKLLKLHNKSFYVTIGYWWENGIGLRDPVGNSITRTLHPRYSDLLIQMTGIGYGAELERSTNKIIMSFKVKDYMTALKHQPIFNSPFFDACSDVYVVRELGRMAGFADSIDPEPGPEGIDRRPLGYLDYVLENRDSTPDDRFEYNGEKSKCRRYDLKGSYATVAEPAVRFKNTETFENAIKTIAQMGSKCAYFDRWGVLRYENSAALEAMFEQRDWESYKPVFHFVSSPFAHAKVAVNAGKPDETVVDEFIFDSRQHAAHLIYNVIKYSRSVEDAVNQIVLWSATSDHMLADGSKVGGFISEGHTFFDQIFDPTVEGFIGYRKPGYQSNGVFGDVDNVRKTMAHYAKARYPLATISFETYGVPGLKPLDIIAVDGNLFYITDISHTLSADDEKWWMNVNAEWYKPFTDDLGFLTETGEQESGTPNNSGGE